MNTKKYPLSAMLSITAIAGNIIFTCWILFNGIQEGFKGTIIEKFSYVTLMALLMLNAFLLFRNSRKQSKNN